MEIVYIPRAGIAKRRLTAAATKTGYRPISKIVEVVISTLLRLHQKHETNA
jgi:hypothetical protein